MSPATNIYNCVMEKLREKRIPQRRVAAESGVPFSTVCKIAQGSVKYPSVHSVQRLYDYFYGLSGEGDRASSCAECCSSDPRHGIERRKPEQRSIDVRRKEAA